MRRRVADAISAIRQGGSTSDASVRVYRFSYHAGSHSYSLDSEFPVSMSFRTSRSRYVCCARVRIRRGR